MVGRRRESMLLAVLAVLVVLAIASVQASKRKIPQPKTYNCNATTDANCASFSSSIEQDLITNKYTINQYFVAKVLVTTADPYNLTQHAAVFYPRVDEFTLMRIPNTSLAMKTAEHTANFTKKYVYGTIQITIPVNPPISTCVRQFSDIDKFSGFLTVVARVNHGELFDLTWEDNCDTKCSKKDANYSLPVPDNTTACCGDCLNSANSLQYADVNHCEGADSTDCDVRVYLIFTGTDKKGRTLTSSQYSISNFRAFAIDYTSLKRKAAKQGQNFQKQKLPTQ